MKANDWMFVVAIGGILVTILLLINVDPSLRDTRQNTGWVHQGNHSMAYKEILKEESGCIYFVDVWGNEGRACGAYTVTKH